MSTEETAGIAELVEAVRSGDGEAFGSLYREFVGLVQVAVRDQVRDPEHVADAVQETFARALASLHKLREPDRFRPWLMAIARNTAIDIRRERSRIVLSEPEESEAVDGPEDPAELAAIREIASMVHGLVGGLSSRDAVALRLVILGFDVAEVAAALGVRHGAAKVVLHRARRRLRAALVLRLLANGATTACRELPEVFEKEGMVAAGRHAETCPTCGSSARRAVYG